MEMTSKRDRPTEDSQIEKVSESSIKKSKSTEISFLSFSNSSSTSNLISSEFGYLNSPLIINIHDSILICFNKQKGIHLKFEVENETTLIISAFHDPLSEEHLFEHIQSSGVLEEYNLNSDLFKHCKSPAIETNTILKLDFEVIPEKSKVFESSKGIGIHLQKKVEMKDLDVLDGSEELKITNQFPGSVLMK
jgi:hypothetical protein